MQKHVAIHHKFQESPTFQFNVVKYCHTALQRQVSEAVRIANRIKGGGSVMNSTSEFNRSKLPRIIIEMTTGSRYLTGLLQTIIKMKQKIPIQHYRKQTK